MIAKLPDDGPFPRAAITLDGAVERQVGERPAVEVEEMLRAALASGRARDRAAGRTLDGPHRADLLVRHSAEGHAGRALLDRRAEGAADRPGHFACAADRREVRARRRSCCSTKWRRISIRAGGPRCSAILDDLNCQTFMTGTEAALFSSLEGRAQFLTVSHGTVSERRRLTMPA